eukprot:776257-Prymnesium_polylepis.1
MSDRRMRVARHGSRPQHLAQVSVVAALPTARRRAAAAPPAVRVLERVLDGFFERRALREALQVGEHACEERRLEGQP